MANFLYNTARQGFLTTITVGAEAAAQIDWENDNIRVALVEGTYVGDETTHTSYADLTGVAAVVVDEPLAGRTSDGAGTASASSVTFTAVPAGDPITAVVIYKSDNVGVPSVAANCPLIVHLDDAVANLPITPNGGDITIIWNSGSGEIFRL